MSAVGVAGVTAGAYWGVVAYDGAGTYTTVMKETTKWGLALYLFFKQCSRFYQIAFIPLVVTFCPL